MSDFQDVLALTDLPPNGQKAVRVGSCRVLVCREGESEKVWAVHDECPHAFQSFMGGAVRNGSIQCPQHGACFDLETGKPLNRITAQPVLVFPVRVEDGRVLVAQTPLSTGGSRTGVPPSGTDASDPTQNNCCH